MKARTTLQALKLAALLAGLNFQSVGAAEVSGCLSEFPASNCGIVQATVELQPLGATSENVEFFSFEGVAPGSYVLRVDPPCSNFGCWVPTVVDVSEQNIFILIPMQTSCIGDCNNDCVVRIDEVVRGVGILLGEQPLSVCSPLDRDFSGTISVEELVASVDFGLGGCLVRSPACAFLPRPYHRESGGY